LTLRTNGGPFILVGESHYPVLLCDGVKKYSVSMLIDTNANTVQVIDPIGRSFTITNVLVSQIKPFSGIWQEAQNMDGVCGQWSSVEISTNSASPNSEETAAENRGDWRLSGHESSSRQYVNGTTPVSFNAPSAGWYRVATAGGAVTSAPLMYGHVTIDADALYWHTSASADVNCNTQVGGPSLSAQISAAQYAGGCVTDIRASMDTGSYLCGLDIHVSQPCTVYAVLDGIFAVNSNPTVGATAYSSWSSDITFSTSVVQLPSLSITANAFTGNGGGINLTNAAGAKFTMIVNSTTNGFVFVPQ
jgi:hypothetical protein